MLLNFVLSAESTKLNRVRKFLRLQYMYFSSLKPRYSKSLRYSLVTSIQRTQMAVNHKSFDSRVQVGTNWVFRLSRWQSCELFFTCRLSSNIFYSPHYSTNKIVHMVTLRTLRHLFFIFNYLALLRHEQHCSKRFISYQLCEKWYWQQDKKKTTTKKRNHLRDGQTSFPLQSIQLLRVSLNDLAESESRTPLLNFTQKETTKIRKKKKKKKKGRRDTPIKLYRKKKTTKEKKKRNGSCMKESSLKNWQSLIPRTFRSSHVTPPVTSML